MVGHILNEGGCDDTRGKSGAKEACVMPMTETTLKFNWEHMALTRHMGNVHKWHK
jgi:hypothetical protein